MQPRAQKEYRILSELRRCCWYAIFGMPLIAYAVYWTAQFVPNREPVVTPIGCGVFLAFAFAMVFPLRWKVRMDQDRLSVRRFNKWDLWQWSDLDSGRVSKMPSTCTLYDPQRPWHRRKLRLGYMSPGDIQEVFSVVNKHYQLPPGPDLPDAIKFKYSARSSATLDRQGVHVWNRKKSYEYVWDDVKRVVIMRLEPARHDFHGLLLVLPDIEIRLGVAARLVGEAAPWNVGNSEVIHQFLLTHVPPERIEQAVIGEPSKNRNDLEKQLKYARKTYHFISTFTAVMASGMIATFIWMVVDNGVLKALLMISGYLIMLGMFGALVFQSLRRRVDEAARQLDSRIEMDQETGENTLAHPSDGQRPS